MCCQRSRGACTFFVCRGQHHISKIRRFILSRNHKLLVSLVLPRRNIIFYTSGDSEREKEHFFPVVVPKREKRDGEAIKGGEKDIFLLQGNIFFNLL